MLLALCEGNPIWQIHGGLINQSPIPRDEPEGNREQPYGPPWPHDMGIYSALLALCEGNPIWQTHGGLSHWGQVRICISKLTITGSDNGLSPGRHQAIIWTNAGILLTGPLGANFSEILNEIPFHSRKCICRCCLENCSHFASTCKSNSHEYPEMNLAGIENSPRSAQGDPMPWKYFLCCWPFVRGIHPNLTGIEQP